MPGTTFAVESLDGIDLEPGFMERATAARRRSPGARSTELFDRTPLKLLARHEELDPEEFWALAEGAIDDRLVITWSSATALLEISAPDVTKASTLALLCADLGIDATEVIAFGDMPNDLPMLTWAGTSYAMADAHPRVDEAADQVAPGHDEDGVARVLAGVFDL